MIWKIVHVLRLSRITVSFRAFLFLVATMAGYLAPDLSFALPGIVVDTAHYYMKHSYDVQRYTLNLDIYHCYQLPYPRTFTATEIITFRVDSTLNSIKLNARSGSLQIDSVGMAAASFSHASDTLKLFLDRTYQPGEIYRATLKEEVK